MQHDLNQLHAQDLLQEAQHARLVRQAQAAQRQPRKPGALRALLHRLRLA
ncbi:MULTISPECIES: hypothetical protein [Deinococcus]|nr:MULTISPECIES: hypothetical protein [Deinococcus]